MDPSLSSSPLGLAILARRSVDMGVATSAHLAVEAISPSLAKVLLDYHQVVASGISPQEATRALSDVVTGHVTKASDLITDPVAYTNGATGSYAQAMREYVARGITEICSLVTDPSATGSFIPFPKILGPLRDNTSSMDPDTATALVSQALSTYIDDRKNTYTWGTLWTPDARPSPKPRHS